MGNTALTFLEIQKNIHNLKGRKVESCKEGRVRRGLLLDIKLWTNKSLMAIEWSHGTEWNRNTLQWRIKGAAEWPCRETFQCDIEEFFMGPIQREDGEIFFMLDEYNYAIIFSEENVTPNSPRNPEICLMLRHEIMSST